MYFFYTISFFTPTTYMYKPRSWRIGLDGPASGRLGVHIPAATDLNRKTGSDSSTAKRSAIGVSVTGPRK